MKKLNKKGFTLIEGLIAVFVLVLVVGLGFYAKNRIDNKSSKAESESGTSSRVSGYLDWRLEGDGKYSKTVTSTDGWLCAHGYFSNYNGMGHDYHMYAEEKVGNRFVQVRQSKEFQANGNHDEACWDRDIVRGHKYRIKYDPDGRTFMHGDYVVEGYR